jgi:DNA-binding NtrC family response regulator
MAMKTPVILIVAGDEGLRHHLKRRLIPHDFEVILAKDQADQEHLFQTRKADLVIIGANRRKTDDGLETIGKIRRQHKWIPIIFMTTHSSEARVIAALRAGVNDYFKWPCSEKELIGSIRRNLSDFYCPPEAYPKTNAAYQDSSQSMIGQSQPMREINAYLLKVASTDSTVLITGETGTGKELAAQTIHTQSPRHHKPFVCINCSALPENLVESELFGYNKGAFTGAVVVKPGKFELANTGTVFLDEVGDMNPYAQAKILRSIESKAVEPLGGKKTIPLDLRIIAATNQDPEQLMAQGKFREDLYYRLNVARVHLPPLRERKEDIFRLITHAIEKMNRSFNRNVKGLTDEAMTTLFRYDWPGNVRELMNLIEASFINLPSRHVDFVDLPRQLQRHFKLLEGVPENERKEIVSALIETKWNKSKAAQKLCWSRTTIYRKISRYNIVEKRNPDR